MFLLSISRTVPAFDEPGLTKTVWSHGAFADAGWKVATWTDSLLGEAIATPQRFALREAAPRTGSGERMLLCSCELDAASLRGTLFRVANSGRAVYHHVTWNGSVLVASHLRLLKAAGVDCRETAGILPELLLYRQACPPRTLLEGVEQLAAGDRGELSLVNGSWVIRRVPGYCPPLVDQSLAGGANDPAVVAKMREKITGAIHRPGVQGSSIGCLLSGGLDSSVITAAVHETGVRDTFSCVYPFEDAATDTEYRYATSAAQALGTRHEVHLPTMSDYLHGAIDATAIAEEPVMHLQSVLVHLLCKDVLRPRGYSLVPCGEGADGMFGGRLQRLLTTFAKAPYKKRLLELPGVASLLREISRRTNRWGMIADLAPRTWRSSAPFTDPDHILWSLAVFGDRDWIRGFTNCSDADMVGRRPTVMAPFAGRDLRDCVSILALLSESSETQVIWGKLGEAEGMCFTYPYLDQEVSDFTYSIPWGAKLAGPKPVLRAVAREMGIPDEIVFRPKASFDVDPRRWGSRGGVFEPLVQLAFPAVNETSLRQLQSPYVFKAHTLWTVIGYGLWKRLFVGGESVQSLHAELDRAMETLKVGDAYRTPGRLPSSTGGAS